MALVACSALSTLSVAVQGLINVPRDHHLVGPVSLYLLALADSGKRKTSCDAIFGAALLRWESERRLTLSPEIKRSEAVIATFQAKRSGLLDPIKLKRRRSLESIKEESSFEALLQEAPLPLPVPRLFYVDATPEALAHALETGWPSAGAASSLTVNATITGLRFCFVAVLWPVDALEQMSPVDEVRTLLAAYSACLTGAAALPGRITSVLSISKCHHS